ncbi:MAG: Hsp33 family molecular chaperone HslO [Prochlorotrichaceae cyanobacterium]|jgi:molecular chaperone Hsp33
MTDQLIRATAAEGGIRAVGCITTGLTAEARQRHELSFLATTALGRSMAAGLLLASSMKQPQSRVNLRLRGSGPLGGLFVDAGLNGTVRGYVHHPEVELPLNDRGQFDVSGALGVGYLHVVRDLGYGQPHTSTVELVTGEIGEDVAFYLAHSEQTPSALVVGVLPSETGVQAAGGLLVQILPSASHNEPLIELLESRISHLNSFTHQLSEGKTLTEILDYTLGDLNPQILGNPLPLCYHCPCSPQRMLSALKLFGAAELQDMIVVDQGAEISCDFCGEKYHADVNELNQILAEITP